MRAGQNPAKFAGQTEPAERVTVSLITFIPHQGGYYAESLEVLKATIASLKANTQVTYDLMIFDNGSEERTVEYLQSLQRAGDVDYLVLSKRNIGKGRAWDFIFSSAPGEIIAYADSDVFFERGWLSAGLELLEEYPNVGMVTCRPMRTYPEGSTATLNWAKRDPEAELNTDKLIPWRVFREHEVNLGNAESEVRTRFEQTEDYVVVYHGKRALVGAEHWQFLAKKDVLCDLVPLGIARPLGGVRVLDEGVNDRGYLRLMTLEPYVRHMGNRLEEDFRESVRASRGGRFGVRLHLRRFLEWRPVRWLLFGVYNRIFKWYFER